MKFRATRGFSLSELIVTIAVAAVVAGIAAPNMREFMLNNRLTGTATELIRTLQSARSEAVKRQSNVVVCMSANPTAATPTCATSNYSSWIVFVDTDNDWDHDAAEAMLESHAFEPEKIKLLGDQGVRVSFAASGFMNATNAGASLVPSTTVVMCDERGNEAAGNQSTARGITIEGGSGRPTLKRQQAQIAAFSSQIPSVTTECPT